MIFNVACPCNSHHHIRKHDKKHQQNRNIMVLYVVLMFVLVLVLNCVLIIVLCLVLMIVLFLVLKVAIDLIHWAFKSWCSFLPFVSAGFQQFNSFVQHLTGILVSQTNAPRIQQRKTSHKAMNNTLCQVFFMLYIIEILLIWTSLKDFKTLSKTLKTYGF